MISDAPLISIIIPVYNVGQYLERCLTSLVGQTYSNMEIIMVDDCSTDNSSDVCKRFVESDGRFRYFRNVDNKGAGEARQVGIDKASGNIIGFVDGDDWVTPDFISSLYSVMEETGCSIVCCQYYFCYENGKVNTPWPVDNEKIILDKYDALYRMSTYDRIGTELWNKFYKREVLLKHVMTSCHYEDAFILMKYFMEVERICVYCVPLYYYFQREGSLMNSVYTPEKELAHFQLDAERSLLLLGVNYSCRKFYDGTARKGIRSFKTFVLLPRTEEMKTIIYKLITLLKELSMKGKRRHFKFKNRVEMWLIIHARCFYSVIYTSFMKLFAQRKIRKLQRKYKITSFQFLKDGF